MFLAGYNYSQLMWIVLMVNILIRKWISQLVMDIPSWW
jgi:hypothetical protein